MGQAGPLASCRTCSPWDPVRQVFAEGGRGATRVDPEQGLPILTDVLIVVSVWVARPAHLVRTRCVGELTLNILLGDLVVLLAHHGVFCVPDLLRERGGRSASGDWFRRHSIPPRLCSAHLLYQRPSPSWKACRRDPPTQAVDKQVQQ